MALIGCDFYRSLSIQACCLCLATKTELFYCTGCSIPICSHCSPFIHENSSFTCDPCRSKSPLPKQCWACPHPFGLLEKSPWGWIHVLCQRWLPWDVTQLHSIPLLAWHRQCSYCQSRIGITVPCDAGLCKERMHGSCIQGWKGAFVQENEMTFLYCLKHAKLNHHQTMKRHSWFIQIQKRIQDRNHFLRFHQTNDPLETFQLLYLRYHQELDSAYSAAQRRILHASAILSHQKNKLKRPHSQTRRTTFVSPLVKWKEAFQSLHSHPDLLKDCLKRLTCAECQLPVIDVNDIEKDLNQVRLFCETCQRVFHGACCDPPIVKHVDRRRYVWQCQDCDEEGESSSELEQNENE